MLRCRICADECVIVCGTTRADKCSHCGEAYRKRVRRKSLTGFRHGTQSIFITLTAPGRSMHGDGCGGICPCTPEGGTDIAAWNVGAGKRWNRFVTYLARLLGCEVRTVTASGRPTVKHGLRYFKATEVQKRGALHFHAVFQRLDGQPFVTTTQQEVQLDRAIQRLAIRWGFGCQSGGDRTRGGALIVTDPGRAAGYVAKYISKAAASRKAALWSDPSKPRLIYRRGRFVRPGATYRTWSASRDWGPRMTEIKSAQRHWVRCMTAIPAWGDRISVPEGWATRLSVPDVDPVTRLRTCRWLGTLHPVPGGHVDTTTGEYLQIAQ